MTVLQAAYHEVALANSRLRTANDIMRARFAKLEAEIAELRAKLAAEQTRRQQADLTIQAIGMKLGTTDEWTDAETMDADVLRAASTYEGQLTAEEMRVRQLYYRS